MKSVSFALALLLSTPALAGGAYDGKWAVQLVTEKGDCDRSLSWDVGVAANRIADGGAFVQTSGAVDPHGRVTLTVTQGSDRVSASGKLSGAAGSGAWTSPTRACSGRWRASKRA
jgi:hypothetical protein